MVKSHQTVVNDPSNEKIWFADFEIDTARRLLLRAGDAVALNAKAFDLLAFLAKNAGRVLSKNEILDAVWENQFVEEANLKVQISALRKVLGERRDEHRFLVTVPGKGYKFVADTRNGNHDVVIETHKVSHVVVEHTSEIDDPISAREVPAIYDRRRNKIPLLLAIVAAIVLTALVGGAWYFSRNSNVSSAAADIPARELTIKKLTNRGRVNRVKLSPDGRFFAYTLRERGSYGTEIRLGQTDGGSDVLLRPVSDFSHYPIGFSMDGNWLYYVEIPLVSEYQHSNGTLYKVAVLQGVPQKLNDSASVFAVLSPDEKQIAFPRRNGERSAIVIADLNGANEREAVVRPPDQFIDLESLSWSADGKSIAFSAAAGRRRNDSSKRSYEIFAVNLADGSVDQVTEREWNQITPIEWLKDGAGLVAVASSSEQVNTSSLWLIDRDGKTRRLSRDVNRYAWLSLAADSNTMITVQAQSETNIWLAPESRISAAAQITHSSPGRQDGWYGMDWTPDGRVVHTAWIDESLTLWIMDARRDNARQLTSIGFRDERPMVTADGKFVVFESNRSGAKDIWRMDIDGSNLHRLTADGGNSHPSVTFDGNWVVYRHVDEPKSSLRRVPLNGGEPVVIVDKNVDVPRVSPDGKLIASVGYFDGETKIVVYSIDGGEPLKQYGVPKTHNFRYWLHWSPDGKFISYPDAVNGIWMQSLNGDEPTRLEDIPVERTFSYAWSRDGKQFAFGRQRETRDAVLIRDFR